MYLLFRGTNSETVSERVYLVNFDVQTLTWMVRIQCKTCKNGRSWIRLKGAGNLHGQDALCAVVAHTLATGLAPNLHELTRENFHQLRTLT